MAWRRRPTTQAPKSINMRLIPDNSISEVLSEWNQEPLRLWDYSCSHSQLTLRIERTRNVEDSDQERYLHIECVLSKYYSGPLFIEKNNICIMSPKGKDQELILVDSDAGLKIQCKAVTLMYVNSGSYFGAIDEIDDALPSKNSGD